MNLGDDLLRLQNLKEEMRSLKLDPEVWISQSSGYLGKLGESLVCDAFSKRGFTIFRQNWRTPHAEVDFVAVGSSLVVVGEVKTRFERGDQKSLFNELGHVQLNRLMSAATWIWFKKRRSYREFRCLLFVVTKCGIESVNLPLLYDHS